MSLETLLDSLSVPSVTPLKNTGEPAKARSNKTSHPCSPDSPGKKPSIIEALLITCQDLEINPAKARDTLTSEDFVNWVKGYINVETLPDFVRSLMKRKKMEQTTAPTHFTEHSTCKQCGTTWPWFTEDILTCPWCQNQTITLPIPNPQPVYCGDCEHFKRITHPNLGHCIKGEQESISGLWDTDQRYCESYLQRSI